MKKDTNYKIIASDVDGTLLNSQLQMTQANKQAIAKAISMGIEFIIVTGRNDVLVKELVTQLSLNSPVIGCNGASVRHLHSDTPYVLEEIDKTKMKELLQFFCRENILFAVYSLYHIYYPAQIYERLMRRQRKYFTVDMPDLSDVVLEDIMELVNYPEAFIKICTFTKGDQESAELLLQLKQFKFIDAFRPTPFVIDIVKHGVSKGNALRAYAEKTGVAPEHILAIGDGENDISMLDYAGMAVAMDNSAPAVFAHADQVTASNNEDGVARALEKIIF